MSLRFSMIRPALASLAALALILTACTGDDGETSETAATTQPPPTTTESTNGTTEGTTEDPTEGTTEGGSDTEGMSEGTTDDTTTTDTTDATTEAETTTTGDTEGTTGDTEGTTGDTEGTTGGAEDPNWPAPDPMNPMMPCPEDHVAASFVMGGVVCSPPCVGIGNMCPQPEDAGAMAACVFNPDSSAMPCMEGEMCDDESENCVQTGGGGMACLKAASHCALICQGGASCPPGMECMGDLVCQYPA